MVEVELKLGRWSKVARVVVVPGIPVPVLLGTDIYELTSSNPVMVTTRAQARKECNITARTEKNSEESTSDPCQTTKRMAPENVSDGECSEPNVEQETPEQRREEATTSTPQELSPLEANADDIRQWQAIDPTLAKARDEAREEESDD